MRRCLPQTLQRLQHRRTCGSALAAACIPGLLLRLRCATEGSRCLLKRATRRTKGTYLGPSAATDHRLQDVCTRARQFADPYRWLQPKVADKRTVHIVHWAPWRSALMIMYLMMMMQVLGMLAFGSGWDGALAGGLRVPEPGDLDLSGHPSGSKEVRRRLVSALSFRMHCCWQTCLWQLVTYDTSRPGVLSRAAQHMQSHGVRPAGSSSFIVE